MKKNILIFILVFSLLLGFNLFILPLASDEIWNYGFSYNILNGEVPYRDFNMVLTPLFSFVMALPLAIFGNNILVFYIFNNFIILGVLFFLYKFINNNMWFCAIILILPFPILYPSYNMFLLFLFLCLIFLEMNKQNDYLIGFILGCLILTKQSVGFMVLLPCLLYCIKDRKKLFSRIIGCIIPCCIFLIYLLITKSFYQFIDLCFLGLFDFAENNAGTFNFYFFIFTIICIITLIFIIKEPKNIYNYYALMFYSISIPLFDAYHVEFQLFIFTLLCFLKVKNNLPIHSFIIFLVVYLCFCLRSSNFFSNFNYPNNIYPNNINHFEYKLMSKNQVDSINEVNRFIKKRKDYDYVILNSSSYLFRIINDEKMNYIDLINMGNWGANGSDKLLSSIKNLPKNTMIFVDNNSLTKRGQIDKSALKYVVKYGKKIDKVSKYDVYILEN